MTNISVDFSKNCGKIKPMHATNNGPASGPGTQRGNFETFSALGIPFVRNHDASLSEAYGSQHVVDVHCIFTDFSKDPNDESAYDFAITDVYTQNLLNTGSQVFYRLGSSIEHWVHKYGTVVPADFQKWATICEHIIMHYNEGWANGFHFDIRYWEIWNEPDLGIATWGGTPEQFFDLYEVAAKHLKQRFPHLKIGGPALAGDEVWAENFLQQMQLRQVPLDFFSWHIYCSEPEAPIERSKKMNSLVRKYGYDSAENILNEWNYVKDWGDRLGFLRVIKGLKGASFSAAVMCAGQNEPTLDMLMYYDARIEKIYNGLFSSDTLLPLKGYYAFSMFNKLYRLGTSAAVETEAPLYASAATNGDTAACMFTHFCDDSSAPAETVLLQVQGFVGTQGVKASIYLLDESKDAELVREEIFHGNAYTLVLPTELYNSYLVTFEKC